ncbi:hypothetical protein CK203_106361 [Vitis vinifera]|uniref:Uncharacterized protein n=1 Tax=Vitis vinifera TaxID=29760 RepID=A0A438F7S0_VITVI|nr:hypothetical protein CK203_106361 [Vitis vinifera]
MLPRLSSLLANSILVNELYVLGIVLPYDFRIFLHDLRVKSCPEIFCNIMRPFLIIRLVASMVLQVEFSATEGLACTWIGNRMASDGRRSSYTGQSVSAPLSARLIFSIVHSVNCCKIRSLETDSDKGEVQSGQDGLVFCFIVRRGESQPDGCSRCSPVGDCNKSPTPEPDEREAPSTRRVHHSCSLDSWCWLGLREYSSTKSAITWPFLDNLGWNSIPNSLNSMAHCSIRPVKSGLCRMLRRGWSVSTITGWA